MPRISVSNVETLPLPLPCPLLSVTLLRRQLSPLLGDDVGLKSGAPATQQARFGQNRVRGGATVKRKRSHRTPVNWGEESERERGVQGKEGGGDGKTVLHTNELVSVFLCLALAVGATAFSREHAVNTAGACELLFNHFPSTTFT